MMHARIVVCALLAALSADAQHPLDLPRKQALDRAWGVGESFRNFSDPVVAARSLTILAETVCKYDHAYAATLFTNASNTLATVQGASQSEVARARGQLMQRFTACDAAVARRFIQGVDSGTAILALRNAHAALNRDDPGLAADLAATAMTASLGDADVNDLVDFLLGLRAANAEAASDDLFVARLGWEAAQPAVPLREYVALGRYIFESPEGATDLAMNEYIRGALALLSVPEPGDAQARYRLLESLMPIVQQCTPDLMPQFTNLLAQLAGVLHVAATWEPPQPTNDAEENREIKNAGSPADEDDARVRCMLLHWQSRDTKRMRALAAGLTDPDLQSAVDALITYAEAVTDPRAAARVQPSTKSALLWLGKNDVSVAVRDSKYADPELRPLLLLAAARATVNAPSGARNNSFAWRLLSEAVDAWNEADALGDEDGYGEEVMDAWDQIVDTGVSEQRFPLRAVVTVDGLSLRSALPPLVSADPDRVEALFGRMRNDERRAEALTYVAGARLAKAFYSVHPQEPPAFNPRQPVAAASSPSR